MLSAQRSRAFIAIDLPPHIRTELAEIQKQLRKTVIAPLGGFRQRICTSPFVFSEKPFSKLLRQANRLCWKWRP